MQEKPPGDFQWRDDPFGLEPRTALRRAVRELVSKGTRVLVLAPSRILATQPQLRSRAVQQARRADGAWRNKLGSHFSRNLIEATRKADLD
jgi:hypothetical protein